jgi:hypothetical protein
VCNYARQFVDCCKNRVRSARKLPGEGCTRIQIVSRARPQWPVKNSAISGALAACPGNLFTPLAASIRRRTLSCW